MFIELVSSTVSASNHTKYISLNNEQCITQHTLIDLYPTKCSQGISYYPFAVYLAKCVGSCETLNNISNRVCVPDKTEDLNLSVFNMMTGINESKKLTQDVSS